MKRDKTKLLNFKLETEHEKSIARIKNHFINAPILLEEEIYSIYGYIIHILVLYCLRNIQGNSEECMREYASNKTTKSQQNYCIKRKKLLTP